MRKAVAKEKKRRETTPGVMQIWEYLNRMAESDNPLHQAIADNIPYRDIYKMGKSFQEKSLNIPVLDSPKNEQLMQPIDVTRPEGYEVYADDRAGTAYFKRDEQNKIYEVHPFPNPGWLAEIGTYSITFKPELIRLNHTTGGFQPGLYHPDAKDKILKVTSDTLAGLAGIADLRAGMGKKPEKPEKGSNLDVWFDYYHDMKNAKYKMTFKMLEDESGYSENTFKQAHGNYKRKRGID